MEVDDILRDFDNSTKNVSSQDIYSQLTSAMLNERMAPDLLPYRHNLLDQVLTRISNQQQFLLDSHEYGDINIDSGIITSDFKLQLMIIETEIERLNYLVRLYLRIRLSKLDKFSIYYINLTQTHNETKFLSQQEQEYVTKHFSLMRDLYNNSFLKKVPRELAYLDTDDGELSMIVTPDVEELVFVKVVTHKTIIVPLEDDDDELELVHDGIYVAKYNLLKKYLEIGEIQLI